ncbi:MAG: UvrD-helicase domain-containing protein [Acidobacteria bacterium]|nr:UvrD-helicase domain-containing protein [Acidobacteriota bacterium]
MTARANRVIEAGAGTGKTTTIVRHVLDLLLRDPDADPERIVLTTFTEKAAAEIADRIREALTDIDATMDDDPRWPSNRDSPAYRVAPEDVATARVACARHLQQIDRLRSQTIHSFCQSLLRLYPIEAGLPAQFRIIEGYEKNRVLDEIWSDWLEEELSATADPGWIGEWTTLFRQFAKLDSIREEVFELSSRAELLRDEELTLGDPGVLIGSLRAMLAVVCELRADPLGKVPREALDAAQWLRTHEPPASDSIGDWLEWSRPFEKLLDLLSFQKGPRTYTGRAELQQLRGTDGKEGKRPSPFALLRSHRVGEALREVAVRFATFRERAKEELGAVDFDDLLTLSAALLDDPRVLAQVRARYDHIFVDEFQDTDRVQAKIVDLLARESAGNLVPGRVTVVGDPKQSIYAFRSADPETYRATVEGFVEAGATKEFLGGQFRSAPRLVAAINAMFGVLLAERERDPNVVHPVYQPLEARREDGDEDGPVVRILLSHDSESDATDDEAAAMAEWIARDLAVRPGALSRYAILPRKNKPIAAIAAALAARGIASVTQSAGSLLEQPAIVDLMATLRAVAHPFDLAARVSAARSSLFAITDDEIGAHHVACERECACIWSAFEARLDAWREVARRSSVGDVIDFVLAETDVAATASLLRDAGSRLSHFDRIREIAVSYDRTSGGSLAQFVDDLAVRREEEVESEPNLADHDADAVRIMTVHGSKGLEFDTVLLPDLSSQVGGGSRPAFATAEPKRLVMTGSAATVSSGEERPGHDDATLASVMSDRMSGETDRLFYVAVTRAASRVVFVTHPGKSSQKDQNFLKRLRLCLCIDKGQLPDHFPDAPGESIESLAIGGQSIEVAFERCAAPADAAEPSRFANDDARAIVDAHSAPSSITDALCAALRPPPSEPDRLAAEVVEQRLAAARYRERGSMLHRVLERWDGDAATLAPLVEALRVEAALGANDAAIVRDRVVALCASDNWQWLSSIETLGREVVIHVAKGGAVEELRIDRLLRDGDQLVVLDYKSGRADEWRLEKDKSQVRRYCEIVTDLAGEPCRGLLWYVSADTERMIEARDPEFSS